MVSLHSFHMQLSELEARAAHVARENTRLTGLLEDERTAREQLEEMVGNMRSCIGAWHHV